jgi:UDP-glucose 4-epimerase
MRILVTGGAGYVGSVSVERLLEAGHRVTVLDSLVTGRVAAVPRGAELVTASVADRDGLIALLLVHEIEAVLHCAARSLVGESTREPALYYHENVGGGLSLLDAMRLSGVSRLVLSSTAAVYGVPAAAPIPEDAPLRPINAYGATKAALEGAMRAYGEAYGLRTVALRYFNVAGATATHGEDHRPETHLIPTLLRTLSDGRPMTINGDDYDTPDGTCVRDYLHVVDLADAHLAALELTDPEHARAVPLGLTVCNLGSGHGFSVLEVLAATETVTGRPVPHVVGARRAGDPPVLVATNERARELLGWSPRRGTLEEMIGSAWEWRPAHPRGYDA